VLLGIIEPIFFLNTIKSARLCKNCRAIVLNSSAEDNKYFFPHSCTVHLEAIKSFIYPTHVQLECSKIMSKFTLKFILKMLLNVSA